MQPFWVLRCERNVGNDWSVAQKVRNDKEIICGNFFPNHLLSSEYISFTPAVLYLQAVLVSMHNARHAKHTFKICLYSWKRTSRLRIEFLRSR